MKTKVTVAITFFAILAIRVDALFAQGCPMCKESARAGGEKFTNGLDASILSLFFLPFAIGGVISAMVFKSWWDRSHPGSTLSIPQAILAALREKRTQKMLS